MFVQLDTQQLSNVCRSIYSGLMIKPKTAALMLMPISIPTLIIDKWDRETHIASNEDNCLFTFTDTIELPYTVGVDSF